jgi:hypothetical protein
MYHNGQVCEAPAAGPVPPSCAHTPDGAGACHTHAPHRKGKRTALIWGISGTVLSAAGWIALMLFEQYNASLAELRGDLKNFNEARAELVKKESLRKMVEHVKDCYKELQAAATARELMDRELKASEKTRRALARELQKVRERLAAVEGRQAATTILLPTQEARAPVMPPADVNPSSTNLNAHREELLFQSDGGGQIHDEWRRFWMNDQPSHMTYERVHGGIGP